LSTYIPAIVALDVETEGSVLDPLTGDMVSMWSDPVVQHAQGLGAGVYAAPAGILANWYTGTVLNGHILRGKTYIVPIVGGVFQTDGSIENAILESLRTVVDTFVTATAGAAVVWSRPTPVHAGGFSAITAGDIPDKCVILTSRRD